MASPVLFIKKRDGSLHLVQDYRKLNAMTVKNSYPLIPDILNNISKAKVNISPSCLMGIQQSKDSGRR